MELYSNSYTYRFRYNCLVRPASYLSQANYHGQNWIKSRGLIRLAIVLVVQFVSAIAIRARLTIYLQVRSQNLHTREVWEEQLDEQFERSGGLGTEIPQLVAQHSGENACPGRRTFPILRQTDGRPCDHFVGKASAIGQPTWPTQPAIPPGSVK